MNMAYGKAAESQHQGLCATRSLQQFGIKGLKIQVTVILRSPPFLLADDEGSPQWAGRGRSVG